jgi:hypothetical protein
MKAVDELRSLFSPYELAAGGMLASYALILAAIAWLWTGGAMGGLVALIGLASFAHLAGWYLGRCPSCGKSALKFYLLNKETGIGEILFARRAWPERRCSSCRTDLDGI